MAKKGNNIYERKDGRFEGRFYVTVNGKRKTKYVYGTSYEEVFQRLETEKAKIKRTSKSDYQSITVADACQKWLEAKKTQISITTMRQYQFNLQKHIIDDFGKMDVYCLAQTEVEMEFKKKLEGKNLKKKTANTIKRLYQNILEFSLNDEKKEKTNIKEDETMKPKQLDILNEREVSKLSEFLKENTDTCKAGILCMLRLGLKTGEACALKWSDISFDRLEMTINKIATGLSNEVLEIRERIIPIPKDVADILYLLRKNAADAYIISGTSAPIIKRTFEKKLSSYLNLLKIEGKSGNSLRNTFVYNALMSKKMDIRVLAYILGIGLSELERFTEVMEFPWDMAEMQSQIEQVP